MSLEDNPKRLTDPVHVPTEQETRERNLHTAIGRLEIALRALSMSVDAADVAHWSTPHSNDANDLRADWGATNLILRGAVQTAGTAGKALIAAAKAIQTTG